MGLLVAWAIFESLLCNIFTHFFKPINSLYMSVLSTKFKWLVLRKKNFNDKVEDHPLFYLFVLDKNEHLKKKYISFIFCIYKE